KCQNPSTSSLLHSALWKGLLPLRQKIRSCPQPDSIPAHKVSPVNSVTKRCYRDAAATLILRSKLEPHDVRVVSEKLRNRITQSSSTCPMNNADLWKLCQKCFVEKLVRAVCSLI